MLVVALRNWGAAYLIPWFVLSARSLANFGRVLRRNSRVIWSAGGQILSRLGGGAIYLPVLVGLLISLLYDPPESPPDPIDGWRWRCGYWSPDISCVGVRGLDEGPCTLTDAEVSHIDGDARRGTSGPGRLASTSTVVALTLAGVQVRVVPLPGDHLGRTYLLAGNINPVAAEKRLTGQESRLTPTEEGELLAEATLPADRCVAAVSYSAPLWWRFFRVDAEHTGYGWLIAKSVVLVLIMAVVFALLLACLACGLFAAGAVLAAVWTAYFIMRDLCGAMFRLGWIVAKWLTVYRTRLEPVSPATHSDGDLVLLQISDIHLSATALIEAETRGDADVPCAAEIEARLQQLLRHCAMFETRLLVTGDITDRGTRDEWQRAEHAFSSYGGDVVAILGNHDLNIGAIEEPKQSRADREERRRVGYASLRTFTSTSVETFPEIVRLNGCSLVLLDSNVYAARQILSNAIGLFGKKQLEQLAKQLAGERDIIVAAHHHIALHSLERATHEGPFLVALDGPDLLALLARHALEKNAAVLFVHGHKHHESYGVFERDGGRVFVYEHPSSTRAHAPARGEPGRVARIFHAPGRFEVVTDSVAFEHE